jgi:hypothetical protein
VAGGRAKVAQLNSMMTQHNKKRKKVNCKWKKHGGPSPSGTPQRDKNKKAKKKRTVLSLVDQ